MELIPNLSKLKVLVVEDLPPAMTLMKSLLRSLGISDIHSATDGREAQTFLDNTGEMVDLIICDWNMPNANGLELLQQVRTVFPKMLFMMVTANSDEISVKNAMRCNVDAYVIKPFTADQIEKKLLTLVYRL